MSRFVIPLSAPAARRESAAGGKASVLARLTAHSVRVPEGFVVSTAVFTHLEREYRRLAVPAGGGTSGGNDRNAPPPDEDGMRAFMRSAPIPRGIEQEILAAYRSLGGPAAVRSSLVGEDHPDTSFAGQLESFLDVADENRLMEKIRACLASALTERISRYMDACAESDVPLPPRRLSMAVLVQRMIAARAGGVAFGADPATGRFCVIIEAAIGPGPGVAGGRVIPDRYVIGRRGTIVEARRAGGAAPALDEAQVLELAGIVRDIERRLDAPLDIEWAHDGSKFYVLQARPIGSLARVNVYSRSLAADMAPGVIKPLMWSTSILDMTRNVFEPFFALLLGTRAVDGTELVELIHSRVYANVTLIASLLGRAGLPVNLFESIARDDPAIRPRLRRSPRAVPALARLAILALRHARIRSRSRSFIDRHERLIDQLRRRSWDGVSQRELFSEAAALRRSHGETQRFMWIIAVIMAVRRKLFVSIARRHAPGIDPSELIAGCDELRSLAPNIRLAEISSALRSAGPGTIEAAALGDDALVRERLSQVETGGAAAELFDRFMEQFGHLSASGTDFTVAPWIETPGTLWQAAALAATESGGGGARGSPAVAARSRAAADRSNRSCAERLRREGKAGLFGRFFIARLLAGVLDYIVLRDRMSYLMSSDAYQSRRIYLALGGALARDGALESAHDIFFLEFDEIGEILSGEIDSAHARELVRKRRIELAADELIDPEDVVFGTTRAAETAPVAAGECLEGIPGSAGVVKGYARIVQDPSSIKDACGPLDLLVVPFMDIGWTPLFRGIGGIVAETGGQLSHSAIVAREYGIPAVVSVAGATRIIHDGQPLTVDGTRGRVYLSHI